MNATASHKLALGKTTRAASRRLDKLWRDYLSARDAAEHSRDVEAGIAAGHAWRRWLGAFEGGAHVDGH